MWECTVCNAPIASLPDADQHYKARHPSEWAQIQADRQEEEGGW